MLRNNMYGGILPHNLWAAAQVEVGMAKMYNTYTNGHPPKVTILILYYFVCSGLTI